jgi:hypothetical protein
VLCRLYSQVNSVRVPTTSPIVRSEPRMRRVSWAFIAYWPPRFVYLHALALAGLARTWKKIPLTVIRRATTRHQATCCMCLWNSRTIQTFSMSKQLTEPQRKVWLFLNERSEKGEPPPTYREISKHFRYASPKAAFDHATALVHRTISSLYYDRYSFAIAEATVGGRLDMPWSPR